MAAPDGASCPHHAGALAVDVCERCGRFVCGECLDLRDDRTWCAECAATPSKASARASTALLFGLLGFSCCAPFSIAAIAMGLAELRAVERGEAPAAGTPRLRWAVGLGAAQLCVVVLLVASFIVWRLLRPRLTGAP